MNRLYILTLILGIIFFLPSQVNATHIVGGEITYNCLGNNQFRIIMSVYRDCFTGGAGFDNPARLTVYGGDNLVSPFNTYNVSPIIESIPPDVSNPCLEPPPNICVEEGSYAITLTLPYNPDGYYLSYERCCRNPTINNIQAPNTVGATYSIFISDLAQTSCNDSPVFNDFPPIVICNEQEIDFDHSATDAEGDSLVYFFCAPFIGATPTNPAPNQASPPPYTEVSYVDPPFNAQFPVGGNPLVTIDSTTGIITGIPQIQGQYVVGVCVEEYRNDTLLSRTQRDFQFNVTNCTQLIDADIQEDELVGDDQYIVNSCGDSVVTFINESQDANFIDSYEWEFDIDGTIVFSDLENPTITFPDTGLYFATLILNNGNEDCTDTADIWINIFPPIEADYEFVYDTCSNGPIQFTDFSTTGATAIVDWDWSFGDGNFSDDQNPSNQFMNPAIYEMALNVTDANGCEDFLTQSLEWFPSPDINFTTNTNAGCEPLTVDFQNTSLPFNADYTLDWEFGDGNTFTGFNPTNIYDTAGIYTVIIHATSPSGCMVSDTFPNQITVYHLPAADFTYQYDSCEIAPVSFFDNSTFLDGTITDWFWEFGDDSTSTDQNPSHQYLDAGTYNVTLTVTDEFNCEHTTAQSVNWFPAPIIDINPSIINGCAPLTVEFENNSYPIIGYTTVWNLGDGSTSNAASPIHTYPDPGIYTVWVTITSPTNCVETDTFFNLIQVDTLPTANFTFAYDSCAIDVVSFFDGSVAGSGDIAQWEWNFGDDSLSVEQNPQHQYADAGSYDVELIITNTFGCKDTINHTVDWFPAPIIDIDPGDVRGCVPFMVEFENNSYPINGYTTIWDLGDGSTSNAASPIHTYDNPGVYTVSVTITSPTNCVETDTFFNLITVDTLPTANFQFIYDTCVIAPITFQDQSIAGSGTIDTWDWTFGDGNFSNDQSPVYQYQQPGDYNVKLVVTNIFGCTDSITQSISWWPSSDIDLGSSDPRGCTPHQVSFTNSSLPVTGYSILWDFGDGNTSDSFEPSHIYQFAGTYSVSFTTISPTGCIGTDTLHNYIIADSIPIADYIFTSDPDSCIIGPVTFTDTSIPGSGDILSWTWDFDDNSTSDENNPVHLFNGGGAFDVELLIEDENGCTDSTTQTVLWAPSTVIDVTPIDPQGCTPHTVFFQNNSFPIIGYDIFWDFGDGATSTTESPTHTYTETGIYDVTLTVISPLGCLSEMVFEDFITVDTIPTADFSWNLDDCEDGLLNFRDESLQNGGFVNGWSWNFGDGNFSDLQNPSHAYEFQGTYMVSLQVTDENGCTDMIEQEVTWWPPSRIDIAVDDYLGCIPHPVQFINNSDPLDNYDVFWEFGDGNTSTEVEPAHIYESSGNYDVTISITTPTGCTTTETVNNMVRVMEKPVAAFSYSPPNPNNFEPEVQFTDESQLISQWEWDFGNGDFALQQNPFYSYPDTGVYVVTLVVTQLGGCQDSTSQLVDVEPLFTYYLPNAFTPNEDGVNDGFRGAGITYTLSQFEMTIWNRWGELVFQTNDPEEAWNGRRNNNGRLSPLGVYVYQVNLTSGRGERHEYKGFVTLVR
ncbi:MAG: PKD domain-containing protein [Bacteroidota bacterium]